MNPIQMAVLRQKMEARKSEIASASTVREMIQVERCADALDEVQAERQRDLDLYRFTSDAVAFRQIADAEERIADGTYGTCLECEEPIGIKRLNAIPWVARCIDCQEQADRKTHEEETHLYPRFADVA
jgi:DnaK suppressor protein